MSMETRVDPELRFLNKEGMLIDGLIEIEAVNDARMFRAACRCGWLGSLYQVGSWALKDYEGHLSRMH